MSDTTTIQMAQRGVVTLPKSIRDYYHLKPGDEMTFLDLGGVFILSPRRSQVDYLADGIREAICERGETLESMLDALRQIRQSNIQSA